MDEQFLTCNNQVGDGYCRKKIRSTGIVTTCSHIICENCADATGFLRADPAHRHCPTCNNALPNQDDALIANLNPTEEYKTIILSGLDPGTVMECANRALAFWNYQIRQETMYQQEVLNAMNERYKRLSHATDKIVQDANTEMEGLHGKIQTLAIEHAELQRKCHEIAAKDRERTKKYNEIRVMYDTLKKRVLREQQQDVATINAERAVNAMTTDLKRDGHNHGTDGTSRQVQYTVDGCSTAKKPYPAGIEQLHPHQRSGSLTSSDFARMPPPKRPAEKIGLSPGHINIQTTYRSPIPGVMRATANRAGLSSQHNHLLQMSSGPSTRQQFHTDDVGTSAGRAGISRAFGGISSGMKIGRGDELVLPIHNDQTNPMNIRGHSFDQHRHNTSFPTADTYR